MLFTLTIDSSAIGRVNPSLLSDHQLMELFFTPGNREESRQNLGGDEDDACTWAGVRCDKAGCVDLINFDKLDMSLAGAIEFRMLPPAVTCARFNALPLSGTVDTTALPIPLEFLQARKCRFSGTLSLGNLPRGLIQLVFGQNRITAVESIENLPESLQFLEIDEREIIPEPTRIGKFPDGDLIVQLNRGAFSAVSYEDTSDSARITFTLEGIHSYSMLSM